MPESTDPLPEKSPGGPNRRSDAPVSYWRRATKESRWSRRFSRRSMIDTARTLTWIIPLTIVIWVYAEREQTRLQDVTTAITVVSSDRSKFVEPADGVALTVNLTLSGPQASVEQVREKLTSGIPRGVQIDIGDNLPPGRHQLVNVINAVEDLPEFKGTGVTVTKSQPPQIVVNVDRVEERDVDVQIPPRVMNLTSATTFEPRKVRLRGPSVVLNRLEEQGNLHVYADIAGLDVLKTPGKKDLPSVPLMLSQPEDGLTIQPPNVRAILDVRAADVQGTIDSMPIAVQALPAFVRANEVTLDSDTIANVRVVGPPEKISLLVDHHLSAQAVLEIRPDGQSQLKFELPDGVRPAAGESDRAVGFKARPRDNN